MIQFKVTFISEPCTYESTYPTIHSRVQYVAVASWPSYDIYSRVETEVRLRFGTNYEIVSIEWLPGGVIEPAKEPR